MSGLRLADMASDPFTQFARWFEDARNGGQPEPEAMAVATAGSDGAPSVRFVLMRGFDARGWVFFTNRQSRKGRELWANPRAALAFRWSVVDRQVRVAGPVTAVDDAESDAYFASRPRGSQLAAWASEQSRPIEGDDQLEHRYRDIEARYAGGPVPRPPHWGGYRIGPAEIEFWQQGTFRMHDRFRYRPDGPSWRIERLCP